MKTKKKNNNNNNNNKQLYASENTNVSLYNDPVCKVSVVKDI